jgi:hypothetical protein
MSTTFLLFLGAVFLAVLFAAVVLAFFAAGAFGVRINLKIREV